MAFFPDGGSWPERDRRSAVPAPFRVGFASMRPARKPEASVPRSPAGAVERLLASGALADRMQRDVRIPRIYVDLPLDQDTEIVLPSEAVRHLRRCCACRAARSWCSSTAGAGSSRRCSRSTAARGRGRGSARTGRPPPKRRSKSVSRRGWLGGGKMDYLIQKAVELGISWIQPLATERSMVQLGPERARRRRRHWQGIVAGACEQCGRTLLPPVHDPLPLGEWLEGLPDSADRIVAVPGATRGLAALPRPRAALAILVGPRGRARTPARWRRHENAAFGRCRLAPGSCAPRPRRWPPSARPRSYGATSAPRPADSGDALRRGRRRPVAGRSTV